MSQEEFGLYGYLFAMVGYLATLLNGGFYLVQSKLYFSYLPAKRGSILFTINIILISVLFVTIVVLIFFDIDKTFFELLFKHPFNYTIYRLPLLIGVFTTAYALMITQFFLASGLIKKLQLFNIIRSVLIHTTVLVILYLMPNLESSYIRIAGTYYVELIITAIFLVFLYRSMTFSFDWAIAKKAVSLSLPITIYIIFSLVIFLIDRFYIERLGSMKDLAIYNLAWVLAGVIPFISNSIHSIWLPELLKETDLRIVWSKAHSMGLKLLLGFSIISIGILVLVKLLLVLLIINPKYEEVIPVLPIVLLGSMVLSIFQLVFNYLLSISRIHVLVYISFGVAIVGVFITRELVLKWGLYGAAVSMLLMNLGLLIPSILCSIYFYKRQNLIYSHENRN